MANSDIARLIIQLHGVAFIEKGPGVLTRLVDGIQESTTESVQNRAGLSASHLRKAAHGFWSETESHLKTSESWNRAHDTGVDYMLAMLDAPERIDQRLFHTQASTLNADAGFVVIRTFAMFTPHHDPDFLDDSRGLKIEAVKQWLRLTEDMPNAEAWRQSTISYVRKLAKDQPAAIAQHGLHDAAQLYEIMQGLIKEKLPTVSVHQLAALAARQQTASISLGLQ